MTQHQAGEAAVCLPPLARVSRPRHALPPHATDCHCHVYDDPARYPLVEHRSYTPAPATLAQYIAMCDQVGLGRTVQVSASVYGADNRLTLDVIAALGQHRARGVAGLRPDVGPQEIEDLHRGGMRGVRVSTHVKGYGGTQAISHFARVIRPLGWHVQVHVNNVDELAELEEELMRVPVPLVFDHLGCAQGTQGPDSRGFQALLRLMQRREDCWTKISSWYRRSSDAVNYSDMAPLVHALVETRPDRLVFGSNWPHPALFAPAQVPDDGHLIDKFCVWVQDEALRNRILVDNPAALYGFPQAEQA
ncbi:amidohydrolase family protein [Achromobacter aloeverae]|nr:amidohydrolase family protein [Achromobacter aloeverae]